MKVSIKDREIELRETIRAHIIYENLTGETFRIDKDDDKVITKYAKFFYAIVLGSDKTLELSFDEFQDWIDDDINRLPEFIEWYMGKMLETYELSGADDNGSKKKE